MADSLRGQFVIAGKSLRDPNFFKTVVLLLEHGPGGALGLVINRPTSVRVSAALGGQVELPEALDRLFLGGPVSSSNLFIVHNGEQFHFASHEILPHLYVGATAETLEDVVRAAAAPDGKVKFRLFSGCAGWGPDQLEGELARADWHLQPGDASLVFEEDPHTLWDKLLEQAYQAERLVPSLQGDPRWN
jgi:putative transcriptional regulator